MRSSTLVQSYTPLTAAQEIAALILAYAILGDEWIKAAKVGQVEVLRISFLKTLEAVRGLWNFLEISIDLLQTGKLHLLVKRTLREIADMALPKRRQRSCPRAVRQPVSSWPRLLKDTYQCGAPEYDLSRFFHEFLHGIGVSCPTALEYALGDRAPIKTSGMSHDAGVLEIESSIV